VIRTLVVDDDFRVADINAEFVAKTPGFQVVGRAHTARAAYEAVVKLSPELVLLDLYLPDEFGLDLLRRLGAVDTPPYVIVITAAKDVATVQQAARLGVMHYLVKPFSSDRLREHLLAYKKARERLGRLGEASQEEVDRLYSLLRSGSAGTGSAPEPADPTLGMVLEALRASPEPLSAAEVAARLGLSRATAQRHLTRLWEREQVVRTLQYGSTGRPTHLYRVG
jgi:response regulator of citrate/malate metabolism